ncbi:hypothetical protein B0H11DRAFT_2330473 [Mycena galericulata]|nr:hypothetical protein B0H11DRAFT_2330473 [Mycena galericulata]
MYYSLNRELDNACTSEFEGTLGKLELVRCIFSYLDPIEHSPTVQRHASRQPTLKDLAAVARTCRTFEGPALDYLWKSATLVNLLRCMPSGLWVVEEVTQPPEKCYMRPRRAIWATDWDRVFNYASRIRHLFSSSTQRGLSDIFPLREILAKGRLLHHSEAFA